MRECGNVVVGYKLACCESSVRGCVVIMEQPIARAPQFRSFFAECPLSDGEEHCSRTGLSRSGLGGQIHGAQSL